MHETVCMLANVYHWLPAGLPPVKRGQAPCLLQQQKQLSEDPVFQSHEILQPFTQVAIIWPLKFVPVAQTDYKAISQNLKAGSSTCFLAVHQWLGYVIWLEWLGNKNSPWQPNVYPICAVWRVYQIGHVALCVIPRSEREPLFTADEWTGREAGSSRWGAGLVWLRSQVCYGWLSCVCWVRTLWYGTHCAHLHAYEVILVTYVYR